MPEVKDIVAIVGTGGLLGFFALITWGALRGLPTWKEVRLAKFAAQKDDNTTRVLVAQEQSKASLAMSEALGKLGEMLRSSAESTDELRIFLRAAMREHDTLRTEHSEIGKRMTQIETSLAKICTDEATRQ